MKKKNVLLVAIMIVVCMALFPPWQVEKGRKSWKIGGSGGDKYTPSMIVSGEYGFLFYPPRRAKGIDTSRLAIQIIIIATLATGVIVATKDS